METTAQKSQATNALHTQGDQPNVKIVAVASDEGAYLPEWIFHHLYMGFAQIHVLLNRTSDNSRDVLDCIIKEHAQVSYEYIDWIDNCSEEVRNNMQFVAYAQAMGHTKAKGDADYVMFLDIDEYWCPVSPSLKITQVIEANPVADSISFQWINHFGQFGQFAFIPSQIKGKLNALVKTVYKVSSYQQETKLHLARNPEHLQVLCNGELFLEADSRDEQVNASLSRLRAVMVVHRLFRSPVEYVSLLARGRPSDDHPLKLNRGGYNRAYGETVSTEFEVLACDEYVTKREQFLTQSGLPDLLSKAQKYIRQRYFRSFSKIEQTTFADLRNVFKVFGGITPSDEFTKAVESVIDKSVAQQQTTYSQALQQIPKEYVALTAVIAAKANLS